MNKFDVHFDFSKMNPKENYEAPTGGHSHKKIERAIRRSVRRRPFGPYLRVAFGRDFRGNEIVRVTVSPLYVPPPNLNIWKNGPR